MVMKFIDLLEITKAAMDMCVMLGFNEDQIAGLEIKLEPVNSDGTAHFSLREKNPVIPEYHPHLRN